MKDKIYNASLAKSPTKKVVFQSNHIFASIIAFCKLEMLQLKTCLNHFALKYKFPTLWMPLMKIL